MPEEFEFPYEKKIREEREARQKSRDEDAKENLKESRDLRIKSLSHWALLSGGTLTLLVPFIQSLHPPQYLIFLFLSVTLLISALITNSLGLFVTSTQRYQWFLYLNGDKDYIWFWTPINEWVHPIGITFYIIGIIVTAIFVGLNIT